MENCWTNLANQSACQASPTWTICVSQVGPPGGAQCLLYKCAFVCVHNYSRCLYNWPLRCQLQRQLPELNYGHWLRLPLCCSHSMTGCTVCSPGSWQCDLLDGGGALLCSGMPISAINNNGHKWERKRERDRGRDTVQTVAARDMKTEILCGL